MEPMRAASASVTRVARVSRLAPSEPATEVGVAPLERLASIDVAPVAVTRLDGQRIVVAPLASIEEIEIPPVGPPEGRN